MDQIGKTGVRVDEFSGVFPVLPSIFDSRGRPDERGLRQVLEYAISAGADGVVFPGLASEYDHLSADERDHLVGQLGKWIGGRIHFIVGASANTLKAIERHAAVATRSGASASMIMTPHSLEDDHLAMARFFGELGRSLEIPIILQNAPKPLGIGMSIASLSDLLTQASTIAFVKEETPPCGHRITALLRESSPTLRGVFGGAGGRYIIDEMNRGACGTMPASEIVEIHVAIVTAHRNGEIDAARALFERALPLLSMQSIFRWRLTKEVLLSRGLIENSYTRAAGPELDRHDQKELQAILSRLSDLTKI